MRRGGGARWVSICGKGEPTNTSLYSRPSPRVGTPGSAGVLLQSEGGAIGLSLGLFIFYL